MGTVNVVIGTVGGLSGSAQAYNGSPESAENVTSSATSAATTNTAVRDGLCARVTTDTAVYVKTGASPTAAAGTDWYLPANGTIDLFLNTGDKVAVIDA